MNRPLLFAEIDAAQQRITILREEITTLEKFIDMKCAQLGRVESMPGAEAKLMMRGRSKKPPVPVYGDRKRRGAA